MLFTHDDMKVPPPREKVPLTLKLPDGAKATAVWFLTPEYELTQARLTYTQAEGGKIAFTVPRIRFWSTVVVELEGGGGFE